MKLRHLISLTTLPLLSSAQSSSPDNQRCYSGAGELAPDYIIPCYTSWTADATSCCKVGDVCLENNACYDSGTGITYQYGCTDKEYMNANCPKKCDLDTKKSSWTGLVYCGNTAGNPDNTWLCHHPDSCGNKCPNHTPWDPQLEKLPNIKCEDIDGKNKAFEAPGTLSDLMRLPHDATGLASYFSAHPTSKSTKTSSAAVTTTTVSTQSASSTSVANSSPASTGLHEDPPSPTSSAIDSSLPSGSNWTKKKTALAAGLGAGIPVGLAMAGTLVFFFQRQRRRGQSVPTTPVEEQPQPGSRSPGNSSESPEAGYSFKAELPGQSKPMHEVIGSPAITELDGSVNDAHSSWESPVQPRVVSGMTDKYHVDDVSAVEIQSNQLHELPG